MIEPILPTSIVPPVSNKSYYVHIFISTAVISVLFAIPLFDHSTETITIGIVARVIIYSVLCAIIASTPFHFNYIFIVLFGILYCIVLQNHTKHMSIEWIVMIAVDVAGLAATYIFIILKCILSSDTMINATVSIAAVTIISALYSLGIFAFLVPVETKVPDWFYIIGCMAYTLPYVALYSSIIGRICYYRAASVILFNMYVIAITPTLLYYRDDILDKLLKNIE